MTHHNLKCRYLIPRLVRKNKLDMPHASYYNRGGYNRYVSYLNKRFGYEYVPKNK